MTKPGWSAIERARQARAAAGVCALGMLGAGAWLAWKHALGLVALDAERNLTLVAYLVVGAVALFAAAQPARTSSRPLNVRLVLKAVGAASVNISAAAFFAIDFALVWSVVADGASTWLLALFVPAGASLWLFLASIGVAPEGGEEISDEDLAEAALILTESQPRWSWRGVFAMAAFMAATRSGILAVYFAWVVAGTAIFAWLHKAFFESAPLGADDLRSAAVGAVAQAGGLVTQMWIWIVFVLVTVVPPLLILSAAVWYRLRWRRDRARLRPLSQSPAARLMTNSERHLLRSQIERRVAPPNHKQRGVS